MLFFTRTSDGASALHRYDLSKRKDDTFLPNVQRYQLSADGKKLLYAVQGAWFVAAAATRPGNSSQWVVSSPESAAPTSRITPKRARISAMEPPRRRGTRRMHQMEYT